MPNKAQPIGMLGAYGQQYGLPTNTRQEELAKRNIETFTPRNEDIIGPDPHGFGRLGNRIGNLMGAKLGMGQQELPPEEARQYAIVEDAQDRFNRFREESPELWQGMSVEDKALTYKRFLSESAADNEQWDLATTLGDDYEAAYNARIKENMQKRKLGIEVDDLEQASNQRRLDNALKNGLGAQGMIYDVGGDDSSGRLAMIDKEGYARGKDPKTGRDRVWSPGEYRTTPPRAQTGQGVREFAPKTEVTPSARKGYRDDVVNLESQMQIALNMQRVMEDAVAEFGSVDFLSTAGAAVSVVNRLMDNVSAIARTARGRAGSDLISVVGPDGEEITQLNAHHDASIRSYLNKQTHIQSELGSRWAELEKDGRFRETYRNKEAWEANVIRLAYTRARAREPGARQLSDVDIRMAMAELGGATTDPESFRRVMSQGLHGDIEKFHASMRLLPPGARAEIFPDGALDVTNDLIKEFYETFGDPTKPRDEQPNFGTGRTPGPGITPTPAQSSLSPPDADGWSVLTMPDGSTRRVRSVSE